MIADPLMTTYDRTERCHIHWKNNGQTTNQDCKQLRRVEGSIVSKALEKSNKTKAVGLPLAGDMCNSFFIKLRAF